LEAERANDGWLVPVRASIACKSPCEIQFYPQKSQAIMVEAVKSETAEEPIPRQEASDDVDLQEELSDDDSEFNELFEAPRPGQRGSLPSGERHKAAQGYDGGGHYAFGCEGSAIFDIVSEQ